MKTSTYKNHPGDCVLGGHPRCENVPGGDCRGPFPDPVPDQFIQLLESRIPVDFRENSITIKYDGWWHLTIKLREPQISLMCPPDERHIYGGGKTFDEAVEQLLVELDKAKKDGWSF